MGSLLPPLQQPDGPPRLDEAGPLTRDRGRVGAGLLSSWDGRERCREATEDWKVRSEPPWRRLGQPRMRSGRGRWPGGQESPRREPTPKGCVRKEGNRKPVLGRTCGCEAGGQGTPLNPPRATITGQWRRWPPPWSGRKEQGALAWSGG